MNNWQVKKLGDIATITRGGSPRPIQDYLVSNDHEGYPWLKIGDVPRNNRYIYKTSAKIKPEGLNKTTLVKAGDFILSNSMSFGRPYIMKINACIHDGWLAIKDIDESIDKQFLYYLLSSEQMQNKFKNFSAGSGVQNLKKETVQNIDFSAPEKAEQERIVKVLEVWDEYLEKLEQRITLKEEVKQAVMQAIFSKKRVDITWSHLKLGEVCTIQKGSPVATAIPKKQGYPVIAGGKESPYDSAQYNYENVISVSASGANAGFVAYQARKIWASDCSVLYADSDRMTLYVYYWLYYNQDRIYGLQTGGAQPHVYPKDLSRFPIKIPDELKLEQIIETLGLIDVEITFLEKKLREIRLQKQYLLKNLITGAIRTPETLTPKGAS